MKALTKNMNVLVVVLTVSVLLLCLCACSSSTSSSSSSSAPVSVQAKDFDGENATDAGEGVMYISTAGGTSEDGNIPQIVGKGMIQIGINTVDMDGSVCTVYVDGIENTAINAGVMTQNTITLQNEAVEPGKHIVELVKLDDAGAPVIYKAAEYEIV